MPYPARALRSCLPGLLWLVGVLLFLLPGRADAIGDISGRLGGVVAVDATGDGLSGVTIKIRSRQLIGGAQTAVTGDDGSYIFQNLPPGVYELTANIEGFSPVLQKNIQVNAGQQSAVDIRLQVQTEMQGQTYTVIEKVNPVLNPESAAAITTTSNEKASKTPIFHQTEAMTQLSPGVTVGNSPSVRGGLARYTRFLVDGLETTDIVVGGMTGPMNFDAVDQFVVSVGAMDAEYNALGAVQNMVTRSGGNKLYVDASVTLQPSLFNNGTRYQATAPQYDQNILYDDRPQVQRDFYSMSLNVGGPIAKDKLWFFTSFQFNYNRQTTPMISVPWYPGLENPTDRFKDTYTYLGRAKLTWQATDSTRIAVSLNFDRNSIRNNSSGTTLAPEADQRIDRGGEWFVLLWDTLLAPKLLFQLQTGATTKREVFDTMRTLNGLPDRLDAARVIRLGAGDTVNGAFNGYNYMNRSGGWDEGTKWRVQFDPSLLYNFRALGEHNAKAGIQFAYMRYDHNQGQGGGQVFTDQTALVNGAWRVGPCIPGNPDTYMFCNQVRIYPDSLPQNGKAGAGFNTQAQAYTLGFFLQDRWTIARWLTLVPGIRLDLGLLYNYQGTQLATLFGVGPRLSAVYDLFHDRSTMVEAHYGRSNDVGNSYIADRGNPQQLSIQQNWQGGTSPTAGFVERSRSGGPGGQQFDDKLSPPKVDEVGVGIHREVISQLVTGLDYTYRNYSNMWVNEEINQIWDPSGARVVGYVNGQRQQIFRASTPDDAGRTYHGVDLWARGTPGNWDITASYTLAFTDGNVTDYFDTYRQNPRLNKLYWGPMPDNYRHYLKGAVDYHFRFGLDVGIKFGFLTGAPRWKSFQSPEDQSFNLYRSPRGTETGTRPNDPAAWADFKLPDQFNLDVQLRYSLQQLVGQRVDIMLQLFNLLNTATPTSLDTRNGTTFGQVQGRLGNIFAELLLRYRY